MIVFVGVAVPLVLLLTLNVNDGDALGVRDFIFVVDIDGVVVTVFD